MGALSTASRVRILARLRVSACAVGELSAELEMEQPAVSHQLRILREHDLIRAERVGRRRLYQMRDDQVRAFLEAALQHVERGTGGAVQGGIQAASAGRDPGA